MKKTFIIILFSFFVLNLFAQTSFRPEITNYLDSIAKKNSTLSTNLKYFFSEGCEKTVNVSYISSDTIIAIARQYLGVRHRMGGTTKSGIDCSGLLFAVFTQLNVDIPHGSQAVGHYGRLILDRDSLQEGDLVFFIKTYKTSKLLTHSGFYIGNGVMIHSSTRSGVQEINFFESTYWNTKFVFGTRLFENKPTSK